MSFQSKILKDNSTVISMIPATKRKRTANACSRCRTRKQRCDGFSLPCKNCARAGTECTFPEDASGERLLREHISVLEAKVNSLSVALKFHEPNHPILNSIENSNLSKNLLTSSKSKIGIDFGKEFFQKPDKGSETSSEEALANGIGFLSLTSGAEPLYVGGSSGASWGRIFSAGLRRTKMNSKQASRFDSRSLSTSNHSSLRPPNSDSNSFPQNPPYYFSVSGSTGLSKESSKSSRIPYHLSTMFVFPSLLAFKPVSDQIFETVYSTIQARHCFMNFPKLKEWYDQRDKYCGQSEEVFDSESRTAAFFLWLSYALGLRLWEGQGRSLEGLPSYEHCFEAALQYFDRVESNTTTIQAFLLLAMFSYRSDKGLSAWHLGGLAMRTALELGLHRKTPKGKRTDPFTEEMRKRVWWSVYSLDRTMAMQLGRPIAIRDKEIDTELPLDIDCHITDPKEILSRRQAIDKALSDSKTNLDSNPYPLGCTSMSFSLHFIRLRIVLTKVKEKIYDDKPQRESHRTLQSDTQRSELDSLLSELEHWKNTIPTTKEQGKETESRPGSCFKENDQTESKSHAWKPEGIPFYSLEWFDLQYYNAIQTLLIPYSITAPLEDPYLKRAVQSATLSCKLQRNRVKHGSLAPLSLYSLHKLFMSGAFLIYASNRHRDFLNSEISIESDLMNNGHSQKNSKKRIKNSHSQDVYNTPDPIHACREVLKVYSSHYQTIQPYYKFYEQIFESSREKIAQSEREKPMKILEKNLCEEPKLSKRSSFEKLPERKETQRSSFEFNSNTSYFLPNSSNSPTHNQQIPNDSFSVGGTVSLDESHRTATTGNCFVNQNENQPSNNNFRFKDIDPHGYGDLSHLLQSDHAICEVYNRPSSRISPIRLDLTGNGMFDQSRTSYFSKNSSGGFGSHENLIENNFAVSSDTKPLTENVNSSRDACQTEKGEQSTMESFEKHNKTPMSNPAHGYNSNPSDLNSVLTTEPSSMSNPCSFENYLFGGRQQSLSLSLSSSIRSNSMNQLNSCGTETSLELTENFSNVDELNLAKLSTSNHTQVGYNSSSGESFDNKFVMRNEKKYDETEVWMTNPKNTNTEFINTLDNSVPQASTLDQSMEYSSNYLPDQGAMAMIVGQADSQFRFPTLYPEALNLNTNSGLNNNPFGSWLNLEINESNNNINNKNHRTEWISSSNDNLNKSYESISDRMNLNSNNNIDQKNYNNNNFELYDQNDNFNEIYLKNLNFNLETSSSLSTSSSSCRSSILEEFGIKKV